VLAVDTPSKQENTLPHAGKKLHILVPVKIFNPDLSAATNTHAQSTVTFKVLVLWLHNQHYYTFCVIGIKMTFVMQYGLK